MLILAWFFGSLFAAWALTYFAAPLWLWSALTAAGLLADTFIGGSVPVIAWIVFLVLAIPLNVPLLRRRLISAPLLAWFRKRLPPISATERIALDAGNTWWDADLFSGRPDWRKLLSEPAAVLSDAEQAFLDGPVEELCRMLDDWQIVHELKDLPPDAWAHIKKHRFFGMIIPEEYEGLGFSAVAHSTIVMKIATRSFSAAVTVMVPNSLGPGELLLHYGTDAQKKRYLPRLAKGEEIPCFALTSPVAGSDAGAIADRGIVCHGQHQGKEVLGFKVTWDKRYITLGPVATVLGVAFKAYDPDGLLGDERNLGITLALIPTDTPGVEIGNRHYPLNAAFQNGPTRGKDVFIPLDYLIGGTDYIGQGWRMLMNCLSVGRAISLPALGTGTGKLVSLTTGAYARIRKQFRVPIGQFEGIEEALTRIAGNTYRMDAARRMTAGALDRGEKPSVLSAVLKYHCTQGMRQVLDDAMDVHGGRGIIIGPRNYLGALYQSAPIAITVEGANILTRSMMIFGQGAIRCHPYLLAEMEAAANPDKRRAAIDFDRAFFSHIRYTLSNAARTFFTALTGGWLIKRPPSGHAWRYYQKFSRASAAFAFAADIALLLLGGKLKRREKLSGRFGDILSHLYMGSAVLKQFEDSGRPAADLPLLYWACEDSLHTIGIRFEEILQNFPSRLWGLLLRIMIMPFGRPYRAPDDALGHQAAALLLTPSAARDRLTRHAFHSKEPADPVGRLESTLDQVLAAEPVEDKLQAALKKRLTAANYAERIAEGLETGAISEDEAALLREAEAARFDAISVDEFAPERAAVREDAEHQAARVG
jgi:acyl-CoA dehydrogenase